jgi:hypothetical protein
MTEVTALEKMAQVAERLAARETNPRKFLRAFAWNCALIRPGLRGVIDLATGGGNRFSGSGFRGEYDDGTRGQVRHFAGVAAAPVILGERLATWGARTALRDPADSADGRLSEAALEFSGALRDGTLLPERAGEWIRQNLA